MNRSSWLVLLLFVVVDVQEGRAAMTKAALENSKRVMKGMCKRSSGVKQEMIDQMRSGNFIDDQKVKCYVHCCLGMMKTMKKNQITVADATRQIELLLPDDLKENTLKQLQACKDSTGTDACDKAYNFLKCCIDVNPNNWLIPV